MLQAKIRELMVAPQGASEPMLADARISGPAEAMSFDTVSPLTLRSDCDLLRLIARFIWWVVAPGYGHDLPGRSVAAWRTRAPGVELVTISSL